MAKAIEWYEKYLKVNPDPELEQKVAIFKMLEDDAGEDVEIGKDANDTGNRPDGYDEAIEMFLMAEEIGGIKVGRDEVTSEEGVFEIVIEQGEAGDPDAKFTAGKYFIASHIEEEMERAIRWIKEAAEAGLEEAEEYMQEHSELFS